MACWNKVSPVSPYLDDVRSGAGEGPVRVCVPRSVGSLQILAVGVSFKEYFWLAFGVATTTSSSVLFCGLSRFLQPSDLVVVDCKLVLLGVMLQPMLLQRLLDLVSRGEWLLRSSKPCVARAFAGFAFFCCWFSAIFNHRRAAYNQRKKKTSMLFIVILFFTGRFTSSCLSFVLAIVSLILIRSKIPFGCL